MSNFEFKPCELFSPAYFKDLHEKVKQESPFYAAYTPNHRGARIPLYHSKLKIECWRDRLVGYEYPEIVQFLEYGFPLGLTTDPPPLLQSTLRNHGSAYQYYNFIDEFISVGLDKNQLTGPFRSPPFSYIHISPLMTAPKKPDSRRAVFDATYGEFSLNNNTPKDTFLDTPCVYDYPQVDDFRDLIINAGRGCFIWKRDLSRFYLQIPLDPLEYPLVCYVWRNRIYFFTSLMFGLTHSGLQGQRITSAVKWIHRQLGLSIDGQVFSSLNYSDDIGGCEKSQERAILSFQALGKLFCELGLDETISKAHEPSTRMPYLGVEFDTVAMTMSVPGDKLEELRSDLSLWLKRKRSNKRSLQQLLGKLFWVSRCIRFSRGFMGRLLSQLRELHALPNNRTAPLSTGCIEDIQWWARYARRFNGVEVLYKEENLELSLESLVDVGALVCCGDAQPKGAGAYHNDEYWSQEFPAWLNDENTPIHIKEFWTVIVSTATWADNWKGRTVFIFCDNHAVVNVLDKEKPRDPNMATLLREFLYLVCTRSFTPVFKLIGSKENYVADFLSRHHDQAIIDSFIRNENLKLKHRLHVPTSFFKLNAVW